MKSKVFILIILLCFGFVSSSSAQSLKFGIRGGVNLSKVNLNRSDLKESNFTGFQIGPTMEVGLIDHFVLATSILYSQKGIKVNGLDTKLDSKTGYIDVPVDLRYKFGLLPMLKPYLSAGPYASFRIADNLANQWKAQTFGAGINLGVGVYALSFLQVGANYGVGLTNDYKNDKVNINNIPTAVKAKNNTWSIFTTIYF